MDCPFCGGKARLDHRDEDGAAYVYCPKCQASGPLVLPLKEDADPSAIGYWNTRAACPAPVPVSVAGDVCLRSIADFERAATVYLAEEQRKPNPDNALVALLCDAVRLAREYERLATRTPGPRCPAPVLSERDVLILERLVPLLGTADWGVGSGLVGFSFTGVDVQVIAAKARASLPSREGARWPQEVPISPNGFPRTGDTND